MSKVFFQCPDCKDEFSVAVPENEEFLLCPKCGKKRSRKEFLRLFFCPECEKVFREREQDGETLLSCPHCKSTFSLEKALQGKSIGKSGTLPSSHVGRFLPESPRSLLREGDIFDKYKILRLLGKGGMAEVYLAEHMILGHFCALKCLLPTLSSNTVGDPTARKRFIREAKLTRTISHPNIVSIYDAGCEERSGILYIVMEYVEGETLAQAAREPLTEKELLEIASQMASALEALDKHNIVHRDIKPSNIMRLPDGTIKLMDLGIAKSGGMACGGEYPLTMDRSVFGTPAYASPEQCRDSHKTDTRSDIYSLGATLYHLATGKLPHDGNTPVEIICNVLKKDPAPLITIRKDLSEKVCSLIEEMMAKDPEKRPENPLVLQRKIRKLQGHFISSLLRFLANYWRSAALFSLLLLLFLVICLLFPPASWQKGLIVKAPPLPTTVKLLAFREMDFRRQGEKRTLKNRLEEVKRILEFLEKPGNRTRFHSKRLEMYRARAGFLANLLEEKNRRKKSVEKAAISRERLRSISEYIRNRRTPFRGNSSDRTFGTQILVDVSNGQLDPNEMFTNFRGQTFPLLFHAMSGILLPVGDLLHGLIREGADVDFSGGSIPIPGVSGANLFNSSFATPPELLLRAGRDDVDHFWNVPILPGCFGKRRSSSHGHIITNACNWKLVKFLVNSSCLTEVADSRGMTVAHYAAAWNQGKILEKLILSASPILTRPDNAGFTPWHYAVRNDAGEAIKLLEQYKVPLPSSGIGKKDLAQKELFHGIRNGDAMEVKKALENGADLKFVYAEGLNALQNSIRFRKFEIMELLLEKGADVRDNEAHMSSLEIAIRTRQPRVFRRLLEKWTPMDWIITSSMGGGEYLPHRIVCSCHMDPAAGKEFLKILLQMNWQINDTPAGSQVTTLHCALHHPNLHSQLLEFLLEKGADPYMRNHQNKTAFQLTGNPVLLSILERYK